MTSGERVGGEDAMDQPGAGGPAPGVLGRLRESLQAASLGADDCLTYDQLKEIRAKVRSQDVVKDEIAEELSAALQQAEKIRSRNLYVTGAYDQLTFIIDCLIAAEPQLILARDERLNLQIEIYRQRGWFTRTLAKISAGSPVGLVLTALAIAFILWTLLMIFFYVLSHVVLTALKGGLITQIFFLDGSALTVITGAALIGGIVSIATRLNEFSRVRDLDPFAMF